MSIEQSQVRDALRGATAALSLTDQDVDRMEALLHARIHSRRTSRLIAAAAAAVVVLGGVLGAFAVSRRTNSLAPAAPLPVGGDIGVWKGIDAAFPYIIVLRADGTVQAYSLSNGLLSRTSVSGSTFIPLDASAGRHRVINNTLELTDVVGPDKDCNYGFVGEWVGDGRARFTEVSQTGPECGSDPPRPPFFMVRVSPVSPAGLSYSATATGTLNTVTDTNELAGTWLLQGSGVILAIGWTLPLTGVQYSIDHKGAIDSAADDNGLITVPSPGRIVLTTGNDSACGPITLDAASVGDYAMTAHVEADPCHRFAGQEGLALTRLQ